VSASRHARLLSPAALTKFVLLCGKKTKNTFLPRKMREAHFSHNKTNLWCGEAALISSEKR
jgi:hypothetical protein